MPRCIAGKMHCRCLKNVEIDMRILWVCNMMPAPIGEALGIEYSNKEGWVSALCRRIMEESSATITLGICFPWEGENGRLSGKVSLQHGKYIVTSAASDESDSVTSNVFYYGFSEDTVHEETYDESLESRLKEIIDEYKPDIIHCFGTEYGHTLAALRAFGNSDKSIIGLQGICHKIAEHYLDGVPEDIAKRSTFRDLIKSDNLLKQKEKMIKRGEREKQCLELAGHVLGRTTFDKESTLSINPKLKYHFMNETLRKTFYEGKWQIDKCRQYSIFMSQGNYPVKGLHYVLKALPQLVKDFPEVHLYIAGDNITKDSLLGKIKISSYGQYLMELIKEGKLENHVTFLGSLSADKMKEQMLFSHIFLSASTIENSPNSVGEAMLLGVPVVASEVGGVPDILQDGAEGLLYTKDNESALCAAIGRVFAADISRVNDVVQSASKTARERHDADTNYKRLLEIYENEL